MRRLATPLLALALSTSPGLARASGQEPVEAFGPIVITAPRIERDRRDTPAAVDRVDRREIRQGRAGRTLAEPLRQVPGLFFQNDFNFAQGLRISTRGFGARAPFGIRGIHLRVDGFPETLPDGQSQTDGIALEAAERIEVIRGPAAVAYGNAAGGVIDVTTADGRDMARSPEVSFEAGDFGFRGLGVQAGGTRGDWARHISADAFTIDGHRQQSETRRTRVNAKLTRTFDGERELQGVITLLDNPVAEDPGGLTRAELEADRTAAAPNAAALDAQQSVEQQRLGLSWRDARVAGGELRLRGFYTRRDFEQQLPFPGSSRLGYARDFFGAAAEYRRALELAGRPLDVVVGADSERQVDERFRFAVDPSGSVGAQTADERQQATATGVFARGDLALTPRLDLTAGARFERVRFEIDDALLVDGDDSGQRRFDETSTSLGARFALTPAHSVYANVATAFETPTFTEFADPDGSGGFNPDVEPQRARNVEVGARGRFGEGLRYDLAVFRVEVDDELIAFERNGRDFFDNAGRTQRDGVELGLDWIATERLVIDAAYTWSDYRFERFVDRDGNDFAGNRLPGLPAHRLSVEADWQDAAGRYARASARYVDSVFADNANRVRVDDYATLDLRVGRTWTSGGRRVELWGGIDNVTDTEYVANVRVNASAGRFFEPAPGRRWIAGVEVGF